MHENCTSESVLESEQEKKEKKLNLKERKVGNFSRFYIYTHIFRGNYKIFFVVEKGKKKKKIISSGRCS